MRIFYPQDSPTRFIEQDGMVLLKRGDVASYRERLQKTGLYESRWRYERSENHVHGKMSAIDRNHIQQELEIAADFTTALRQAYPERHFVITHIPVYAVSFYSVRDDAPATAGVYPLPNQRDWEGQAWRQTCQGRRPYLGLPSPDPEFPFVEWGRCTECGNDVIINSDVEILTPIGPLA